MYSTPPATNHQMSSFLPRSPYFYAIATGASMTGYWWWWDRHQCGVIMGLYEKEMMVKYGSQIVYGLDSTPRVTFILSGTDKEECFRRRVLFRKYTAPLFMAAGVDWQVVQVDGRELAKALNQRHLDDPEWADLKEFDAAEFVKMIVRKWTEPLIRTDESEDMKALTAPYLLSDYKQTFLKDGIVALDSRIVDRAKEGLEEANQFLKLNQLAVKKSSIFSWSKPKPETPRPIPSLSLIDIPLTQTFSEKVYNFFNTRHVALAVCKQTESVLASIHQNHQNK